MTDYYLKLFLANLPVVGIVAGLYLVVQLYRRFGPARKGALEYALVNKGTFRRLDPQHYGCYSDLYLPRPDGAGTTHVAHTVVSPNGIFVIEAKTYTGAILGAEDQAQWTQTFTSGGQSSFPNPIWQNRLHLKALAQFLNLPETCFHPVIFFLAGSTFQTPLPDYVIDGELTHFITRHHEILLQPEQVTQANDALTALIARTDKKAARREYAAGIEKRRAAKV